MGLAQGLATAPHARPERQELGSLELAARESIQITDSFDFGAQDDHVVIRGHDDLVGSPPTTASSEPRAESSAGRMSREKSGDRRRTRPPNRGGCSSAYLSKQ